LIESCKSGDYYLVDLNVESLMKMVLRRSRITGLLGDIAMEIRFARREGA